MRTEPARRNDERLLKNQWKTPSGRESALQVRVTMKPSPVEVGPETFTLRGPSAKRGSSDESCVI